MKAMVICVTSGAFKSAGKAPQYEIEGLRAWKLKYLKAAVVFLTRRASKTNRLSLGTPSRFVELT